MVGARAVSDGALVHRLAYDLGEPWLAVQVDTQVRFLDRPIGHFFFLVARQKAALCLQNSPYGGLAGIACEDGCLKTQLRLSSVPSLWQFQCAAVSSRSPAPE